MRYRCSVSDEVRWGKRRISPMTEATNIASWCGVCWHSCMQGSEPDERRVLMDGSCGFRRWSGRRLSPWMACLGPRFQSFGAGCASRGGGEFRACSEVRHNLDSDGGCNTVQCVESRILPQGDIFASGVVPFDNLQRGWAGYSFIKTESGKHATRGGQHTFAG